MKKSIIMSCRIEEDMKKLLDEESELQQISANSLINKVLKRHFEWERFTQEIGMIYVSKSVFRIILSKLDEKDIKLLAASSCRTSLRDATLYIKKEFNVKTILETFDMWLAASHISFRHTTFDNKEKYVIQHELGKKYSTYLHSALGALLSEVNTTIRNPSLNEHSLSFEIEKTPN